MLRFLHVTLCCTALVAQLSADTRKRVYLSKELASEVTSFAGVQIDKAWQGSPIRVGGKVYGRGLGVHADSTLVFPLDGKYATFNVLPGPDDAQHGQVEMKILVDGQEKWSSGATRSHDGKARRRLRIPLEGAQTLTLIVTQSDGNRGGDHASWANAYLEPMAVSTRPSVAALPELRA